MTADELQAVNSAVNNATEYKLDAPGDYHWVDSDANNGNGHPEGHCADQAIAKWHRCLAAGQQRDDCRFAEVTVEPLPDPMANREHAIMCFRDDTGHWLAADIRHPYLKEPAELPYTWHRWRRDFVSPWMEVEWS